MMDVTAITLALLAAAGGAYLGGVAVDCLRGEDHRGAGIFAVLALAFLVIAVSLACV